MNSALKLLFLLSLVLLAAACGAPKAKPPVVAPLAPANLRLDPICDVRAILKYDRGEGIAADGPKKAEETIYQYCKGRKHKLLVDGERKSGEKKFTRIIVFECIE